MKTKKPRYSDITLSECTVLRRCFQARIDALESCIAKAAGSLYPAIWAAEIERIKNLFEKLTGHPI